MMPKPRPSLIDKLRELNSQLTDSGQSVLAYRMVASFFLITISIDLVGLIYLGYISTIDLIGLVIRITLMIGLYRISNRIKGVTEAYIGFNALLILYVTYKGVINPVHFVITQYCFLASVYIPLKGKSTIRILQSSAILFVVSLILQVIYIVPLLLLVA
jgi:hypothetical protein